MRAGRLITVIFAQVVLAAALYLLVATDLPRIILMVMVCAAFVPYLLWIRIEHLFAPVAGARQERDGSRCARCGRAIVLDPAASQDMFEGMHWLCFHLEFEHDGDADLPCGGDGCPHWIREVYEAKLRNLGLNPREVLDAAIAERYR